MEQKKDFVFGIAPKVFFTSTKRAKYKENVCVFSREIECFYAMEQYYLSYGDIAPRFNRNEILRAIEPLFC